MENPREQAHSTRLKPRRKRKRSAQLDLPLDEFQQARAEAREQIEKPISEKADERKPTR